MAGARPGVNALHEKWEEVRIGKVKKHRPTEKQLEEAAILLEQTKEELRRKSLTLSPDEARDFGLCEVIRQIYLIAKNIQEFGTYGFINSVSVPAIMEHCKTAMAMSRRMDQKLKDAKYAKK